MQKPKKMWPIYKISRIFDSEDLDLTSTQKYLLLALSHYANNESYCCYPSLTRLSKYTNLTPRCIINNINSLVSKKIITKKSKKNNLNEFENNTYCLSDFINNYDKNYIGSTASDSVGSELNSIGSEPGSLLVVNDVHGGSESSSWGVVNVVHPNYPIITTQLTNNNIVQLRPVGPNLESPDYDSIFINSFWTPYPKKEKKKKTKELYIKIIKAQIGLIEIIKNSVLHHIANDPRFQSYQFIPLPTTWLNNEEWTNEIPLKQEQKNHEQNNQLSASERLIQRHLEDKRSRQEQSNRVDQRSIFTSDNDIW